MAMKYMNLHELNQDLLTEIKRDWLSFFEGEENAIGSAEYEQLIDIIEKNKSYGTLEGRENIPTFFSVAAESGRTKALVEFVQSRKGRQVWVKMMDISLCPQIELSLEDDKTTAERLEVFVASLVGIFRLTKNLEAADTIKIFGRTDGLVTFLRGMHDSFAVFSSLGTIKDIAVSIEGRWLVFRAARNT